MLNKIIIKWITGEQASLLCADIIKNLPEWFGIPDYNKLYEQGVRDRICFCAELSDGSKVGMISVEVPYKNNANIYWFGIKPEYHRKKIGTQLIKAVELYGCSIGIKSITVETISSKQLDQNYLKTYKFYESQGFQPLFDKRLNSENLLVFVQKIISLPKMNFIDLTHTLSANIPSWNGSCGFANEIKLDYQNCKSDIKFRVQQIKMHAGIGTHMDAPAHCVLDGLTIERINIDKLFLPCVKIDISDKVNENYSLTVDDIELFKSTYGPCLAGAFVVVYTGWEKYWQNSEQYRNNYIFPSVTKEAAEFLIEHNVAGIGIDTLAPDRPRDGFWVHKLFLENGKLIIENIANTELLPAIGSYILALPLKVQDGTEAPVRLVAMNF